MSSSPIRVAVLGASGIGRIHVREFAKAGAEVVAVLGSSSDTSKQTVDQLNDEFQLSIQPFSNYDDILYLDLDAISIATPWEMHFEQLQKAIDRGLPVFCEKPLFWHEGITPEQVERQLEYILTKASGKLAVNTCNAYFLDEYKEAYGLPEKIDTFDFVFHTQGKNHNEDIGVDLLPHGLSLLLRLAPDGDVENVSKKFADKNYTCSFRYAGIQCHFQFHQDPQGEKKLEFVLNGLKTIRLAHVVDGKYQVSLQREDQPDQRLQVQDPFSVFISNFISKIDNSKDFLCGSEIAAQNVALMAEILFC